VEVGGTIPEDEALLAEVTNLVEAPVALRGAFDKSYLALPREVLISVMKKHQRYFPLIDGSGLMPYFIAVSNRGKFETQSLDLIIEGNEHVIRARLGCRFLCSRGPQASTRKLSTEIGHTHFPDPAWLDAG
jgi:glycyl-tRNA synthetase beta subunit